MVTRVSVRAYQVARYGLLAGVGLFSALQGHNAWAIETELSLSLQQAFLENDFAASKESGQATTVSPGFTLSKPEGKLQFDINYRLDAIFYQGLTDSDREDHNLNLSSRLIHSPSTWYSELNSGISRINVNPDGIQSVNPLLDTPNSRDLQSLDFTTYYNSRLSRDIQLAMDLGVNRTDFERAAPTDGAEVGISVSKNLGWRTLDWSASVRSQENKVSATRLRIDDLGLTVGYGWSRVLRTFGEFSRTETSALNTESDSALLGLEFRPSTRFLLKIAVGERDNGDSYALDIQHSQRHVNFFVGYDEQLLTPRAQTLADLNNLDIFQASFQDLSISPVLQKRADLGVTVQGKRSVLSITGFDSTREQSGAVNTRNHQQGGNVSFSRQLSARSSVDISLGRQKTRQTENNQLDDVSLSWNKQMSKSVNLQAQLRQSEQSSDNALNAYQQRALYLSVQMAL